MSSWLLTGLTGTGAKGKVNRMGKVVVDLSMSLDGYIAGPNDGPGNPLGDGGGALFEWMRVNSEAYGTEDFINPPEASREVVDEWYESGAIISGKADLRHRQRLGRQAPHGRAVLRPHARPARQRSG